MHRIFDPGPKSYSRAIEKLRRELDVKYRDFSTARDFVLKSSPSGLVVGAQVPQFEAPAVTLPEGLLCTAAGPWICMSRS
jgi:hypothetical protein